jgi:hypothetical protein
VQTFSCVHHSRPSHRLNRTADCTTLAVSKVDHDIAGDKRVGIRGIQLHNSSLIASSSKFLLHDPMIEPKKACVAVPALREMRCCATQLHSGPQNSSLAITTTIAIISGKKTQYLPAKALCAVLCCAVLVPRWLSSGRSRLRNSCNLFIPTGSSSHSSAVNQRPNVRDSCAR